MRDAKEPDDTTWANAGIDGQWLADHMVTGIRRTIDELPGNASAKQRAAVVRLVADSLYDYADEWERVDG